MLLRTLIALQCFVVLFIGLHNWIPLGTLNDRKGARIVFPTAKLLLVTLLNFTPAALGLAGSIAYFGRRFPDWLVWELWIFYALAVYGSLKAWWIPFCLSRMNGSLPGIARCMQTPTLFYPSATESRRNTLHAMLTFRGDFGT